MLLYETVGFDFLSGLNEPATTPAGVSIPTGPTISAGFADLLGTSTTNSGEQCLCGAATLLFMVGQNVFMLSGGLLGHFHQLLELNL